MSDLHMVLIVSLVSQREWGPTELLLALRTALGERETALALCKDLWMMLHSARDEPDGIPRQIKEAAEAAAAELVRTPTRKCGILVCMGRLGRSVRTALLIFVDQ